MSSDGLADYLTGHGKGSGRFWLVLYAVHLRKQPLEEMKKPICRALMGQNSHMEEVRHRGSGFTATRLWLWKTHLTSHVLIYQLERHVQ